jgi:hypothetical protein
MTTGEYGKQGPWPRELTLDDQPGPAAHVTRAKADALIENALFEAGFGPAVIEAPVVAEAKVSHKAPSTLRIKKSRGLLWQVAAAVGLCFVGMGSASAAVLVWKRIFEPQPVVTQLPVPKAKKHPVKHEAPVVVQQEPQPLVEEPVIAPDTKPKKRAAEDFLDDANRLRAAKRWKAADEAYARVWQAAPKSSAAYVARVASASVRLEHLHDARTSLSRYRTALEQSPHGALREEIRFGMSEAYRALGNKAEERKTLQAFVHDHPDSGLAQKARDRLAELGSH